METTVQNNIMIAEFMNLPKIKGILNEKGQMYEYCLPDPFELIKEVETTIESNWCEVLEYQDMCMAEDLKFHNSWDWLMPVIDKIQSHSRYPNYVFSTTSAFYKGGIFINTKYIGRTYDDVIDAIKWINN